jgi:hypothetical protein
MNMSFAEQRNVASFNPFSDASGEVGQGSEPGSEEIELSIPFRMLLFVLFTPSL